jgi:lipopolysaccharide transport system ATP-binding protein
MATAIKVENLSKIYRLGEIGTGTISRDIERFVKTKILKQEDPFLKIGETNDRAIKGASDIVYSLKDINFEIEQGDAVGIIGRNGAGKSTLLKILSRVTSPTTGKINIKGRVASLLEVGTGFHPELTGRENIYLNGAILGMRKKEIDRKLDEIIDFSGVERYIDTPVKRYSSGMYVRLAFAVAAHLESEILIVDEVLAVGDAQFQKKCLGKMGQLSNGEGRTVLFVSHNLASIKKLCNKGFLLNNGSQKKIGFIDEVIIDYRSQNGGIAFINKEGEYDLTSHFMKKKKQFGILKAKLFCNGKSTDTIVAGGVFELVLEYKAERDFFNAEIGFAIKDNDGNSYLSLNNLHIGKEIAVNKGIGTGIIRINDFPLYCSETLWINLYFGDSGPDYEILENAIPINVIIDDVFNSGRLLDQKFNTIYHKEIEIEVI